MILNNTRTMPKPGDLPHITRQEFCDRMDDVLDDIEKNRTAYVLTEKGKDDLLVCPAEWFSPAFDRDFGLIVSAAVRYSIGRHTYMPGVVSDFIKRHLAVLDEVTLGNIRRDIEEAFRDKEPDQSDIWKDLLNTAAQELQRRKDTK